MPKKDSIEIVTVLDRSGSMYGIANDMVGGFNQFVKDQAAQPGDARLTLVQFDSLGVETVYEAKPISEVPPLKLVPRGDTPLLDAMGRTINSLGERLAKLAEEERPEKVVVIVITDGEENASQEFTRDAVVKLVEQQENVWKWNFVFIGANMDAIKAGKGIGVSAVRCLSYDADSEGVAGAYRGLSKSVSRLRSSSGPMCFTSDERAEAGGLNANMAPEPQPVPSNTAK